MLPKIDPALIGKRLGRGCYAYVYKYGSDQALKLARNDGTRDYLEWCYVRGRRYGRGSPEMANLPWVYAIGPLAGPPTLALLVAMPKEGWYALMERYDCTLQEHMQWEGHRFMREIRTLPELSAAVHLMHAELGAAATCDMHSRNVMWSAKRGELVITDPSSGGYSGSYRDTASRLQSRKLPPIEVGGVPKPRRAQWKLPRLQQFHMRVQ